MDWQIWTYFLFTVCLKNKEISISSNSETYYTHFTALNLSIIIFTIFRICPF